MRRNVRYKINEQVDRVKKWIYVSGSSEENEEMGKWMVNWMFDCLIDYLFYLI